MKNMKKYSGVLLSGAVILGGVTSATFDFSSLPGADKIKAGSVIQANDILALSTALGALDVRTNGTAPSADIDLVNKGFLDAQLGDLGGKTVAEYISENGGGGSTDYDNDGLPDTWESLYGGNLDPAGNNDTDSLTNLQEFTAGTNPTLGDTDGGGTNDDVEINDDNTDPLVAGDDISHGPDPLPSNITISAPGNKIIASVNDDNYIPISGPDGTADPLVDVQGTVTTTGTTLSLAYEVTGSSVNLPAFTQTVNVPANKTEDGQARDVTLSYPAQTLAVGTGTITATIKSVSDTLNAKKLDIDQNYQQANWLTLAEFTIALDGTNTAPVKLQAVPGIPDSSFGDGEHDFLYMPVVAADGTTWLNNTLGAEYNNVHSANFNPTQQAQNLDDYLAYGSLFQWGRPADGHELRTCTSGTACTAKYSDTSTQSSNLTPANNLFIKGSYDWTTTDSDGSQRTAFLSKTDGTGICPVGFRLPTETELEATRVAENITNEASYLAQCLQRRLLWSTAVPRCGGQLSGSIRNLSGLPRQMEQQRVILT